MVKKSLKMLWLLLLVGLIGLSASAMILSGCGGDDDDDDDDSDVDDTTPDDDTDADDTQPDDDVDDDTTPDDDADDDTVPANSIGGIATDFKQKTPLPGATVEAVSDTDGMPYDPPISAVADTNGYVLLEGFPEGVTTTGIKVTNNGYKATYQYHFELGANNQTFLGISNTLVNLIAGLLGITADPTKGFASGAVYYVNSSGDEEPLGCAHVTFDPAVAEVHYFAQSALGVIPTTDRDWGAGPDHNGEGTNPLLDDEGGAMSFFVGVNADPGAYTVNADADGAVASSTIPNLFADSVAITTVLYMAADHPANPTPTWCTE